MAQGYGTKNESNTQNIFHGEKLNKNWQSAVELQIFAGNKFHNGFYS